MVERKFLAHYIDASFDKEAAATAYTRLGKDLEEYNVELNPDVETKKNILGESSVSMKGYEVQAEVEPLYFEDYDDALSVKLMQLVNERATGDKLKTTMVDVLLKPGETEDDEPTVVWAYREDCYVIPKSVGGDTSGIQIPLTIYAAGNRVKGDFDIKTKKFTEPLAT